MRSYVSRLFAFLVLALLCTAVLPSAAQAKPSIKFSIEHVYMHHAGEVEIVGYFENTGDQTGYIKSFQHDLIINNQDDSQLIWRGHNIHYTTNIKVAPQQKVKHVFHVKNKHIPRYTQRYHWQVKNVHFHWNTSAH